MAGLYYFDGIASVSFPRRREPACRQAGPVKMLI